MHAEIENASHIGVRWLVYDLVQDHLQLNFLWSFLETLKFCFFIQIHCFMSHPCGAHKLEENTPSRPLHLLIGSHLQIIFSALLATQTQTWANPTHWLLFLNQRPSHQDYFGNRGFFEKGLRRKTSTSSSLTGAPLGHRRGGARREKPVNSNTLSLLER